MVSEWLDAMEVLVSLRIAPLVLTIDGINLLINILPHYVHQQIVGVVC